MDGVKITESIQEMIEIGRELIKNKPDTYRIEILEGMKKHIDRVMKDADANTKEQALCRAVYDFWVYGVNVPEEFYYGFRNKSHEEKTKYITFRTRLTYARHLNDYERAHRDLDDKYRSYELMKPYYLRDVVLVRDESSFADFERFVCAHNTFVVKPNSLGLAIGVRKDSLSNYESVRAFFIKTLEEVQYYKDHYRWGGEPGIVLEEVIEQDEKMAALHVESANAIRITTVYVNGEAHVWYPWIKMGVNGEFVTSGALSSINAAVDPETGVIITDACNEYLESFTEHPNTHVVFKGFQVPRWAELLSTVKELAEYFKGINYIGWDMVLTPKGWCVMEANPEGEFLSQLYYERGMKEEFEKLIGWHPEIEFWNK